MESRSAPHPLHALVDAIDDAVHVLGAFASVPRLPAPDTSADSLLEQCLALCAAVEDPAAEPIRTLHHFACTGGSLVSKCLAAMPNTRLLSEVDPLSQLGFSHAGTARFAPTDMIAQLREGAHGASNRLILDIFESGLALVQQDVRARGQRLLLRDHAHGRYCLGADIREAPGLRQVVSGRFATLSLLTVRHPLDSFVALVERGWVAFQPATLDEYCRRYLRFLDDHAGIQWMRYEDLVADPQHWMASACAILELPFRAHFIDVFDALRVSGDSGRSGDVIAPRSRRNIDAAIVADAQASHHYHVICRRLGYDS